MKRHERVNTCAECVTRCEDGRACDPAKRDTRPYSGIRFTSDGFDCALPVSIDVHSVCPYGCLYCFADNLASRRSTTAKPVGQTRLSALEAIFSGGGGKAAARFRKALKYDRRNKAGYPCAVQLGALTDPCDTIERQQGWLLDFFKLANRYGQPVRISTKGDLFLIDEYLDAISERAELYWVAYSLITPDDDMLRKIDRGAPDATTRLANMKRLSSRGIKTALRLRPILPGVSDSTAKHPKAYKELIDRAADAGAVAISYEVGFVPGQRTAVLNERWRRIEQATGVPLRQMYRQFGKNQACIRPAYGWTENIMHAVAEAAKSAGLTIGISDPVWKQLGETGCCCGILPDDPVFGNWEREGATHRLLQARDNPDLEIGPEDIIPPWAYDVLKAELTNEGAGPLAVYEARRRTWADELRDTWNSLDKERGPLHYFQGALWPARKDSAGNVYYRYKGLERQHAEQPYWRV